MKNLKSDFEDLESNLVPFDMVEGTGKNEIKEAASAKSSSTRSFLRRERLAIGYAVLSQFIWACGVVVIKYGTKCNHFSSNSYSMWRSVFLSIVTYFSLRKKGQELPQLSQIKNKLWFAIRTFGTYFSFLFYILALLYLRTSTTSCLSSCYPFVVIVLSLVILRETFYIRYIIGIIVCFIGTAMLVLNEKSGNKGPTKPEDNGKIVIGLFYIILHIISCGTVVVSQKIMIIDGISTEIQVFYTGVSNLILGIIFCLIEGNFGLNLLMIFLTFLNSLVFYYGQMFTDLALKTMDASKFSPISYTQTLFVFIFSLIIFGEKFYFTDIIGSLLIASFHLYNAYNPIRSK